MSLKEQLKDYIPFDEQEEKYKKIYSIQSVPVKGHIKHGKYISLHLKNIFKDNELDENSVTEDSSVTASDGKNYKTKIYNLDAIIAVGYRVNSKKATEFRIWATKILKEYMTKGFALNDERFLVILLQNLFLQEQIQIKNI